MNRAAKDAMSNSQVSIHAPAQGATIQGTASYQWQDVSIHAPAQGAT